MLSEMTGSDYHGQMCLFYYNRGKREYWAFQVGLVVKNPPANAGQT